MEAVFLPNHCDGNKFINPLLLRNFVYRVKNFDSLYYVGFDSTSDSWRSILLDKQFYEPVGVCMGKSCWMMKRFQKCHRLWEIRILLRNEYMRTYTRTKLFGANHLGLCLST